MKGTRAADQLNLPEANAAPYPVRSKESFIQWPSEREIEEVSRRLARIVQIGIRSEANGDYFKSGDLAYQIQEIIRSTAELCRKSNRAK
jgi:hypothetical protein